MRKAFLAFVIAGLMAVWATPASAVVLYSSGTPDYYGGWYSDPTNSPWQAYDDFTLSSAATITGIEWWGFYFSGNTQPTTDAFMYDIQSNPGGGGGPSGDITSGSLGTGSPVATGSFSTVTSGTLEFYEYNAAVNISLPAGSYFLSIYDTPSNPGNAFCWATTPESPTDIWDYYFPSSSWESELAYYGDAGYGLEGAAFNLTGETVPEPATMTLLGLGLAGLGAKVARRRSR
jgi:hypothetical protein